VTGVEERAIPLNNASGRTQPMLRFPRSSWQGGVHPASTLARYDKPLPRNPDFTREWVRTRTKYICDWCGAPNHDIERCYLRDPENLKKYPIRSWVNGQPPENFMRRYNQQARTLNREKLAISLLPTTPISDAVTTDSLTSSNQISSTTMEETLDSKPTYNYVFKGLSWRWLFTPVNRKS
jgi:hypothetical protein